MTCPLKMRNLTTAGISNSPTDQTRNNELTHLVNPGINTLRPSPLSRDSLAQVRHLIDEILGLIRVWVCIWRLSGMLVLLWLEEKVQYSTGQKQNKR
jgi:hypothetical protein